MSITSPTKFYHVTQTNLGLALDIALKFYTRVANSYDCKSYRGKIGRRWAKRLNRVKNLGFSFEYVGCFLHTRF